MRGSATKVLGSIRGSSHVLSELLQDSNVVALLATVPVAKLVNSVTELMLQYIPKKFGLSLASVSYRSTSFLLRGPIFSLVARLVERCLFKQSKV